MRKIIVAASLSLVASLAAAPSHAAVNTVVAVPGSFAAGYATTRVVVTKAAPATFVNLDIDGHDVRSKRVKIVNGVAVPLFKSAVIATGETAPIVGLSDLEEDDYLFFCIVHTDMVGTITLVS